MAAPRLLEKRIVNAEVAYQQKQQIDAGLQLAKKIDALRQTRVEEEANLEAFRQGMLAEIRAEIDSAITERESLRIGNERLREERFALQAPLDLKEERAKNEQQKLENESWHERLTGMEIAQIAAEADINIRTKELIAHEDDIYARDTLSDRTLMEAETKFTQASDIKERAERDAEKILSEVRESENHVKVREEDATNREIYLSKREEEVEAHEVDLANREQKLKRNQEVFIKAKNYLNKKK